MATEYDDSSLRPAGRINWAIVLGALGGLAITTVVGICLLALQRGKSLADLTAVRLAEADALWQQSRVPSYRLEVRISGRQSGVFEVEVRSGEVHKVTRDGVSPARRTWDTWTVEGQFDTLYQELENAKDPQRVYGVSPGTTTVMRAEFDETYGFPRAYERIVLGTSFDVSWRTTRFEVLP